MKYYILTYMVFINSNPELTNIRAYTSDVQKVLNKAKQKIIEEYKSRNPNSIIDTKFHSKREVSESEYYEEGSSLIEI